MYGATYLPRKFKTGFAVPPSNDIDVFSQDLGFIAIIENDKLVGYNVAIGGGLGMSHGNDDTFPRLADVVGFITPDQITRIGEAVLTTQRDYGDRTNRKHARLKYTIEDKGIAWVQGRGGEALRASPSDPSGRSSSPPSRTPHGWHECIDGTWFYGLHILSGRVVDREGWPIEDRAARDRAGPHRRFPAYPPRRT